MSPQRGHAAPAPATQSLMHGELVLTGFIVFAFFWMTHVLVWRLTTVRMEIAWLLTLFLGLAAPALLAVGAWQRWSPSDTLAAAAVHYALALAYLQTYPAIKADVPTFRILLFIHEHPRARLEINELCEKIGGVQGLFSDKLGELESDVLVISEAGRLRLTFAGQLLADFFIFYRRLLGLRIGEG